MPTPEPAVTASVADRPRGVQRELRGWGGGEPARCLVATPADVGWLRAAVAGARLSGSRVIARGMGRSYGDAAQLRGGLVLETTRLRGIELDAAAGTVTAQAGATIGELLARTVPAGWMVPVVPGTQHVSVGGAVAADIHGKNHGAVGTFGRHVDALGLVVSSGDVLELAAGDPAFDATLGGMGLTGAIVWARIRLRAVSGSLLSVDTDRVSSLDEALAALRAAGGAYRVAWLDLLGPSPARGVVTRAEHFDGPDRACVRGSATVRARATVPARWPPGLLRTSTVRAFNELRFRRSPRHERGQPESLGAHMFPLDALDAWPRLYGRRGFVQYQLVVPPGSERVMEAVIGRLRKDQVPCFLAVLKDFGPASGAPLSFPIEGWTLALDLPRAAPGLLAALDACDQLVAAAGGRVYLAKDARLRPDVLRAMYPRLAEWQHVRDQADPDRLWCSDLGMRAGLVEAAAR